jgi:C1A family cysteine protease
MRKYLKIEHFHKRCECRKSNRIFVNSQKTLSSAYNFKKYINFVYDQGELGSCTANAFCAAYRIMSKIVNKNSNFQPSRLFFYYQERKIYGTVNSDSGADVVDGENYVQKNGICSEQSWPYNIQKYAVAPPANCYNEAKQHKIVNYLIISIDKNLLTNIKSYISQNKPVLIAIAVYDSFESEKASISGIIPMPNTTTETSLGGHEVCIVGYDDSRQMFTVLNSWGYNWGDKGFGYIPYNYLTNPELGLEFTIFTI